MKVYIKTVTYILVIIIIIMNAEIVLADGAAYYLYGGIGKLLDEEEQFAQIEYDNGVEILSLTVNLAKVKSVDNAVWIFPVPTKPEKIKIDISSGVAFENKSNLTLKKFSKSIFIDHLIWICASQIYPIIVFDIKAYLFDDELYRLTDEIKRLERIKKGAIYDKGEGYVIHKAISKYGMNTELVSLENLSGLNEYLESKQFKLPYDFMKMTSEYTGKGYSFVVSWFADSGNFKFQKNKIIGSDNVLEVKINFETSKIFFPLKLTSMYGNVNIPINIIINCLVTPILYPEIINDTYKGKKASQVEYYIDSKIQRTEFAYDSYLSIIPAIYKNAYDALKNDFANGANKYTKILIDVPAKNYIDDLWMSPMPPYSLMFVNLMVNYNFFSFLMYFLIISCLSSLFAGKVCYYKYNPSSIKFFLHGIFNVFTILGFILMSFILRINKNFINFPNVDSVVASRPIGVVFFSLTFSAFFLGLNVLFFLFMADVILK